MTGQIAEKTLPTYTRKDFLSSTEPRWCPGCGDYSILNALTSTWAGLGIPRHNFLAVSGIGCSSRLPYYLSTYGFHTLHGRAPTVAIGAKLANPDLSVWVITGDGDGLSIGGNHLIHLIRRNADINVLIFNNEIYGLTKGQASPTSKNGIVTKSSPFGSIDRPLNPLSLALASGATFVARAVDTNAEMLKQVFQRASEHRGTSIVEIFTNCIVFNDGVFQPFENKKARDDATVELVDGSPLFYGKNKDKVLVADGFTLKSSAVDSAQEPVVFDSKAQDPTLAEILARVSYDPLPLPVGVLRQVESEVFEQQLLQQETDQIKSKGEGDLQKLFTAGDCWQVG